MNANDLKRRFGAEFRKASRRLVEEDVPATMVDRLKAIRDVEGKSSVVDPAKANSDEDPAKKGS